MADTGLKTNFSKPPRLPDALDHLVKAAEAAFIDAPFALLKRAVAGGDEREVYAAGWKAYDALINFAAEATNRLYTNESYGRFAGRTIEIALGVNRVNSAVSDALFAVLWPALGLPTAAEIEALREEVGALHDEFRASRAAEVGAVRADADAVVIVPPTERAPARPVWERWAVSDGAEVKASVLN
jgi:hypothetical protein